MPISSMIIKTIIKLRQEIQKVQLKKKYKN